MFEQSLMESTGSIRSSKNWTTTISFATQAVILLAVILLARLNPQLLTSSPIAIPLAAPPLFPPPPPMKITESAHKIKSTGSNEIPAPAPTYASRQITAATDGPAPSTSLSAFANSVGSTAMKAVSATGIVAATAIAQPTATSGRIRISSGTVQANCISCPPPLYPSAAKAVRVSGTVVLDAVISTTGTIEKLQFVSGSPLLRNAAMDAARNWRYKPTILSGQPVEVQTEITVVFRLD